MHWRVEDEVIFLSVDWTVVVCVVVTISPVVCSNVVGFVVVFNVVVNTFVTGFLVVDFTLPPVTVQSPQVFLHPFRAVVL